MKIGQTIVLIVTHRGDHGGPDHLHGECPVDDELVPALRRDLGQLVDHVGRLGDDGQHERDGVRLPVHLVQDLGRDAEAGAGHAEAEEQVLAAGVVVVFPFLWQGLAVQVVPAN